MFSVSTPITDFDLVAHTATTGQPIFDEVVHALGIEEVWWFGLTGIDFQVFRFYNFRLFYIPYYMTKIKLQMFKSKNENIQ